MSYHPQNMFVSDNLTDYHAQLAHQMQFGYYQAQQLPQQQKRTPKLNECDKTDVTHSSIQTASFGSNCQYVVEHLDLDNFKSQLCKITGQHNHKHCQFYHNSKDRKRPGHFYSSDLCSHIEKSETCPSGDDCPMAHNRVEQLYQPEKYKTKFCTYYPNNIGACDYGQFCSFAHSENDIIIELIHNLEYDDDFYMFYFKTVWCPFNLAQHDKALCVYAHNWQDYRRKPSMFQYEPTACNSWSPTNFILNYIDGCPDKFECNKCHGWKELEYHPKNYKTKPCPNQKPCAKQNDCPFYHLTIRQDRRQINSNVSNKVFKYVPKNRIVTNTFKIRNIDNHNNQNGSQQQKQQQFQQSQQQQQAQMNFFLPQQQQQQQQQQQFKGTSSMFTLPSSQSSSSTAVSFNPHSSQQVYYQHHPMQHGQQKQQQQVNSISQSMYFFNGNNNNNTSSTTINNTPSHYSTNPQFGSQQLLDTPPISDNRLKLSKKKKETPNSNVSSLNSNGNNNNCNTNTLNTNNSNGNMNSIKGNKDEHDSEIWLGKGGSKNIEDSFEIEPLNSNGKNENIFPSILKEESDLSGSQTLFEDSLAISSKSPCNNNRKDNNIVYQEGNKSTNNNSNNIPILSEFTAFAKDAANEANIEAARVKAEGEVLFVRSPEMALSQQQQLMTDQMFKDLVVGRPSNQKGSCDYSHENNNSQAARRDEEEMARNVMNLVDE